MRWTERQQAMLGAMGLRLWQPAGGVDGQGGEFAPSDDAGPGLGPQGTVRALARPSGAVAEGSPLGAQALRAEAASEAEVTLLGDVAEQTVTTTAAAPATSAAASAAPSSATGATSAPPAAARAAAPAALSERARLIATLGWPALRESVAGCTACSLCESRTQTVFGVGNEQAQWMIVGEAPGENEDLQGEPFVGKAGQLLDNMLRALQLSRQPGAPSQQVFIANTLKCRPPRNRNPGPEELAQCEPYLQRQIELVRPRVIVALGRFAVKALLGSDDAIGRLRGRVHDFRGTPVIVSYHPAYLLRQLVDKGKSWEDLCLAASLVDAADRG